MFGQARGPESADINIQEAGLDVKAKCREPEPGSLEGSDLVGK